MNIWEGKNPNVSKILEPFRHRNFLKVTFIFIGCCIYQKPLAFGESSSEEDDDECEHCYGHVEKKKKNQKNPPTDDNPETNGHGSHDHPEPDNTS